MSHMTTNIEAESDRRHQIIDLAGNGTLEELDLFFILLAARQHSLNKRDASKLARSMRHIRIVTEEDVEDALTFLWERKTQK